MKNDLLAQHAASGLSAVEFCRRAEIAPTTFFAWRHKPQDRPAATVAFAEVRVTEVKPPSGSTVVVHFGAEISMAVPTGSDAVWLGQVLRAASRP